MDSIFMRFYRRSLKNRLLDAKTVVSGAFQEDSRDRREALFRYYFYNDTQPDYRCYQLRVIYRDARFRSVLTSAIKLIISRVNSRNNERRSKTIFRRTPLENYLSRYRLATL